MTLALVATLSTHALAGDTDGGSFFGEAPGAQPVSGQSPTEWLSADAALLPDRNPGDAIEIVDTGGGSGGGTTDWQATATVTVEERDQAQQDQSRSPAAGCDGPCAPRPPSPPTPGNLAADAGGCTAGGGCPTPPVTPGPPLLVATVPPDPPADPDQLIGDDQPDSSGQPGGYQPGIWVRLVLDFARDDPEYLRQLRPHELDRQLQQLDALAQMPQVRDNSALAGDVAALRGMVAAELQTRPGGTPIERDALTPDEPDPSLRGRALDLLQEMAQGDPVRLARVERLRQQLETGGPVGDMTPHQADQFLTETEQALNTLDRADADHARDELEHQAAVLRGAAEWARIPDGQLDRFEGLRNRVNVELEVHVLLDAILAGAPAERLLAVRADVLDQIRATGGVQLPPGGQRWGRNDVPGWVGTLLDATEQVIDDPSTVRRPPDELAAQRQALLELAGNLPFDHRLLQASALLARLDAIGLVTNEPDLVSGSSDEDLRLAVLEAELRVARQDARQFPEEVLAAVQRTLRDAPPDSAIAVEAATLERELRAAIDPRSSRYGDPSDQEQGQSRMRMVDHEEVGVERQPTNGRPVVLPGLPGFIPPLPPDMNVLVTPAITPKLPDKWVFIPPAVQLPNQTVFIPPPVDQQPLHLQQAEAQVRSQPTPEQDVTPGMWERLNDTFEHAPKPNATTTTITALGLSAAGVYALSRTWIGQLILLFSTVPENSLKGIPPSVSGAATPG